MAHAWRSRVAWRIRWLSALNVLALYAVWGTMALVEDWSHHSVLPWIFLVSLASVIILPFCIIANLVGKHAASFSGMEKRAAMDGCLFSMPQRRVLIFASWVLAGAVPWFSVLAIHLPLIPGLALLSITTIPEGFACAAWLGAMVFYFTTWSLLFARVYPLRYTFTISEQSALGKIRKVFGFLKDVLIEAFQVIFCVLILIPPAVLPFIVGITGFGLKDSFLIGAGMALALTILAFFLASLGLSRGHAQSSPEATPTKAVRRRTRWRWVSSLTKRLLTNHPLVWLGLTRSWGKFGPLRALATRGADVDPGLRALPIMPSQVVASETILLLIRTLLIVIGGAVPGCFASCFVTEKLLFWKCWLAGLLLLSFLPLTVLATEIFIVSPGRWMIRIGLFAVVIGAFVTGVPLLDRFDDMRLGVMIFVFRVGFIQVLILIGLVVLMFRVLKPGATEEPAAAAPGLSLDDVATIGGRSSARIGFFGWLLRAMGVILCLLVVASFVERWCLDSQIAGAEREWRRRGWPPTPEELCRWRPTPPDNENAAIAFRRAAHFAYRVPLPGESSVPFTQGGSCAVTNITAADYLKIREPLLKNNQEALRLAAIASRLTKTRASPMDPTRWRSETQNFRPIQPLQEVLRSIAFAQMAAGSHEEALNAMNSLLASSWAYGPDPVPPWSTWYYVAIDRRMHDAGTMLSRDSLTSSELDRLRLMVASCDVDLGLEEALLGRIVWTRFQANEARRWVAVYWQPGPSSLVPQERHASIGWCAVSAFNQVSGRTQRFHLALLDAGFRVNEVLKQNPASWKEGLDHLDVTTFTDWPLYFSPNYLSYIHQHWGNARTRHAALLTAIAIERFRLRERRLPEKLEELVPAYLAQVPHDPEDDKPLRYRKLKRGYVVYGLGADGQDNGGLEENRYGASSGPDNKPDITVKIER